MDSEEPEPTNLTPWQRLGRSRLRRLAGKQQGEPLGPEDWGAALELHESGPVHAFHKLLFALPSSPRCGLCGAPFAGVGSRLAGPLGYRPSRKNPTVCGVCVEASPPGGMKMLTGVLFADLRGFTARSEGADPEEVATMLRRFYRAAEDVLFPDAVIDKLIGDEVMALYLPAMKKKTFAPADVPSMMLDHAVALLRAVGHGSGAEPFVEMGVGLDIGEAFVGNIGQRALYDFTAVGDVVNTASRLQGQAGPGEIVFSERVARGLPSAVGVREELALKGKESPQAAYRLRVGLS